MKSELFFILSNIWCSIELQGRLVRRIDRTVEERGFRPERCYGQHMNLFILQLLVQGAGVVQQKCFGRGIAVDIRNRLEAGAGSSLRAITQISSTVTLRLICSTNSLPIPDDAPVTTIIFFIGCLQGSTEPQSSIECNVMKIHQNGLFIKDISKKYNMYYIKYLH